MRKLKWIALAAAVMMTDYCTASNSISKEKRQYRR